MRRHLPNLIAVALTLSLLTACSSDPESSGDRASTGTAKSPSTQGATADPAKNGANEMGIDLPDLSKVMFSKQFAIPDKSSRKVTVGILSLERQGKIAILKVVVTPEFPDLRANDTIHFPGALDQSGLYWTPQLLDLTNLKKYKVLHDPTAKWLNYEDGEAVSGQPIYGWAVFAAPPPEIKIVDVTITDWMPRFTNVPIR